MRIRRTQADDAHAIAALSRSEIERGLPPSWTPPRITRLLARDDTNAYTLGSNAGISGFCLASFGSGNEDSQRGHLILLAVAPGLRRQGYGRELLAWQIRAAAVAGLSSLSVELRAGNFAARQFYESLGFVANGRLSRYYAQREDALRMQMSPLAAIDPPANRTNSR